MMIKTEQILSFLVKKEKKKINRFWQSFDVILGDVFVTETLLIDAKLQIFFKISFKCWIVAGPSRVSEWSIRGPNWWSKVDKKMRENER